MRHITSTNAARASLPLVLAFLVGAAGCGDDNRAGPTSPTTPNQPVVRSLNIGGVTTLQRPGEEVQLTAMATYSDGTTRNVSSEANWNADHSDIVSVGRSGLLTARSYGQCNVTASYASVSARVAVRVMPEGMFVLSGRISDETGLPLSSARVSITSSTDLSTSTNQEGMYTLPARGDTQVRAEMDGFEAQIKRLTVAGDQTLDFQLRFETGGFGGMYRLNFIASTSCSLPPETMRRTYLARVVDESSGLVSVDLSGAAFSVWGLAGFVGRRNGSEVQFDITSDYSAEYQFIERVDPSRELAFSGTAAGEVGSTFVTTFSGTVIVRQWSGHSILAQCQAGNHRLEFTR
jgi:hypothetical protein